MKVTLSIVMMTYNQCEFITDAIQSVLNQNLPFDWELLIGDDCSNDNTSTIVSEFTNAFHNIKYFRNEVNLGLHKNYEKLINLTQGDFVALLEADDYWIDPNKCRLQVEMMQKNDEIAWTFTKGVLVNKTKSVIREVFDEYPEVIDRGEFVKSFFNPLSNTVVFRRLNEPKNYPPYFFQIRQWDTILHYLRLFLDDEKEYKIGFVNVNGLAWRRHENAVSTSLFQGKNRYKDWLIIDKEIKKIVPKDLKKVFNRSYIAYEYLSIIYLNEKSYLYFIIFLIKSLFFRPFRSIGEYRDYFWKIRNALK